MNLHDIRNVNGLTSVFGMPKSGKVVEFILSPNSPTIPEEITPFRKDGTPKRIWVYKTRQEAIDAQTPGKQPNGLLFTGIALVMTGDGTYLFVPRPIEAYLPRAKVYVGQETYREQSIREAQIKSVKSGEIDRLELVQDISEVIEFTRDEILRIQDTGETQADLVDLTRQLDNCLKNLLKLV